MTVVNYGKNRVALLIGGSITGNVDDYIIGTGSSTVLITDTSLLTPEDRQTITTVIYPATQQLRFQGDWNSVEMSGIQLTEFGVLTSGTGLTGSIWSRTGLNAVTFDGTSELRIEETWEVF